MEKLLEVRVGGGRVQSGMLPLRAFEMIQDLLASIAEEGGEPEIWKEANPHVEILGRDSTLASIQVEFGSHLRPFVTRFKIKAEELRLGPRGVEFVSKNITSLAPWAFIEVFSINGQQQEPPLRFDMAYRERVQEKHAIAFKGEDEIYARVIRAGGEPPSGPTVQLTFPRGSSKTYRVAGTDLAEKLGQRLYRTAKLRIDAQWDPVNLELRELKVIGIDEAWEDVHLAELWERYGEVLPVELTTDSVEDLLYQRALDRDEG